jgi:hypothetical protein
VNSYELYGASYCRFTSIEVDAGIDSGGLAGGVSVYLNKNIDAFKSNIPDETVPHILVSTSVSKEFSGNSESWSNAQKHFSQNMEYPPSIFVNAYECASWGYALRLLNRFYPKDSYVLLSILDLNVDNLSFWNASEHWGESGFGVMTLLIKIGEAGALKVAEACSTNPMADFCMNIKRKIKIDASDILSMPFFPKATRKLNDRILAKFNRLPDLNDELGHCFGSDPWISVIKQSEELLGRKVLISSLAYSGYWSLLSLNINEKSMFLYCEENVKFEKIEFNDISDDVFCEIKALSSRILNSDSSVEYQLVGSPLVVGPINSQQLKLPITTDVDFKYFSAITFNTPCYVTPSMKYENLNEIVSWKDTASVFTILRLPAPATVPMPDRFLSEDVFCCTDSEYFLSDFVIDNNIEPIHMVSISDRSFIPYIDYEGDNTINISGDQECIGLIKAHLDSKNYNRVV